MLYAANKLSSGSKIWIFWPQLTRSTFITFVSLRFICTKCDLSSSVTCGRVRQLKQNLIARAFSGRIWQQLKLQNFCHWSWSARHCAKSTKFLILHNLHQPLLTFSLCFYLYSSNGVCLDNILLALNQWKTLASLVRMSVSFSCWRAISSPIGY